MYLPDSDKPYTGQVFTNYSSGEKEYQGRYENGLLVQYSYLNKDGSIKEPVNAETLIERGGNLFEMNGQKPYTGEFFQLYPNGNRQFSGLLKGGKRYGLQTIWYENGNKKSEGIVKDGKRNGLWTWYFEDGRKALESHHKDGKWEGLRTSWYQNGQKQLEGTWKEDKEDGLHIEWYENGQKEREVTFKDGKEISKEQWNEDGSVKE